MMTTTIITDRARLLHLLAWLSPAFPTGAFAYSHGLEWAVEAGDVTDEHTLRTWLMDILRHGSARSDAILLRHAHRTATDTINLREIAGLALAATTSRERRDEALNQGRAFLLAVAPWFDIATRPDRAEPPHSFSSTGDRAPPPFPEDLPYAVAVGAAAGAFSVPEDDTAAAYLQTFASNLISAAVRLVPLGQTAGLRVLAALEPVIITTATETKNATLDDIGGCAFRSDLAAMRHETQYTRLFRS